MIRAILLAAGLFAATTSANAANLQNNREVHISFNGHPTQLYEKNLLKTDWGGHIVWDWTRHRAQVMADPRNPADKFLRVTYPANVVGPWHSGAQFMSRLPSADEYWISYKVRFKKGFDFKLGGKLPGLASGDGKYAGGVKPWNGDGWTARLMWMRDGSLVPYLYYVGMPKTSHYGDYWKMDAKIIPGQWHEITQRIHLNNPGKKNGQYGVWLDGRLVTQRNDMEWRKGNKGQIDAFLFSSFHGGAGLDWAPRWNSFIDFDDISVSRGAPQVVRRAMLAGR